MHEPPLILLVDDQPDNRMLLEAILAPEGYRLRQAADGPAALAEARKEPPDLILLDVLMPGLNGFAVCSAVRQDARTRFVPVILLTALHETEDRIRGLDAGADDFISKPVQDDLLVAKVRSLLRLKKTRDELDALRTDFGNMMVHDLRSPVHSILGLVDLLREDLGESPGPVRLLDLMEKSARNIDRRISDFLDLAKLESGTLKLSRGRQDLGRLAREALERSRPLGVKKRLTFHFEGAEGEMPVLVDASRMEQVFDNLLQNAVKHSPPGGRVTLGLEEPASGTVRCRVDDQGPGFPPAEGERLFEKFYQHDGKLGGAGLGLYVCQAILQSHGGQIRAENLPGGGARFAFFLPLQSPGPAGQEA